MENPPPEPIKSVVLFHPTVLQAFFKSMSVKKKVSDFDDIKDEMKMSSDLLIADQSSQSEIHIITAQEDLRREFRQ